LPARPAHGILGGRYRRGTSRSCAESSPRSTAGIPAFLEALDAEVELEWGADFMTRGDTYRGHAGIERWLRGFRQFRERAEALEAVGLE
jgi:hypothetical protein